MKECNARAALLAPNYQYRHFKCVLLNLTFRDLRTYLVLEEIGAGTRATQRCSQQSDALKCVTFTYSGRTAPLGDVRVSEAGNFWAVRMTLENRGMLFKSGMRIWIVFDFKDCRLKGNR